MSARRFGRGDLRELLGLIAGCGIAGVLAGVIWWAIAPRVELVVSAHTVDFVSAEPTGFMVADAWFFLICAAFGAVSAVVLAIRRRRAGSIGGVGTLAGLVAAGLVGAGLAALVGGLLGHADPVAAAAHLADGVHLQASLRLRSQVAIVGWPIGALLVWVVIELRPALAEFTQQDLTARSGAEQPPA